MGRTEVARLGVALTRDPEVDFTRFKIGKYNSGGLFRDAWQKELLYNGKGRDGIDPFGLRLWFWVKDGQSQFFLCLYFEGSLEEVHDAVTVARSHVKRIQKKADLKNRRIPNLPEMIISSKV